MLFSKVCDLDPPDPEFELVCASVDCFGAPIVAYGPPELARPTDAPTVARMLPLVVSRYEDAHWQCLVELETALRLPHVQPIGDGVLVVGTHSRRHADGAVEPNGAIHDGCGRELARLALGDGVEDVQVTASGAIWVSYFDDGTTGDFGSYGWGRLSPAEWIEPIGGAGLVRFDRGGRFCYQRKAPAPAESAIDCFALNVIGEDAWVSYHPRFPLVHVSGDVARAWRTGSIAADAIAVSGSRVALYVSYGRRRHTCRLGALGEDTVSFEEPESAKLDDGGNPSGIHIVSGRGASLHAVTEGAWYRFELDENPRD